MPNSSKQKDVQDSTYAEIFKESAKRGVKNYFEFFVILNKGAKKAFYSALRR